MNNKHIFFARNLEAAQNHLQELEAAQNHLQELKKRDNFYQDMEVILSNDQLTHCSNWKTFNLIKKELKAFEYTISIIKQEIAKHRVNMQALTDDNGTIWAHNRYTYQTMQNQLIDYEECLEYLINIQKARTVTHG